MEETVRLSGVKQTVAPSELNRDSDSKVPVNPYPFATVLRLRVLQIVCGITFLIMGTVGFIEEREELNLGFGIPAGSAIILAAAGSLHTTRGFGGYKSSTCLPGSPFRFLGPTIQIALPLAVLWGTACSFLVALLFKSLKILMVDPDDVYYENFTCYKRDLTILASLEMCLCVVVIISVVVLLRIDYNHRAKNYHKLWKKF